MEKSNKEPTCKDISMAIATADRELAVAQSKLEAAERAAIAASLDDAGYAAAERVVVEARSARDLLTSRLARLRSAHEHTSQRERRETLAKCEAQIEEERSVLNRAMAECNDRRRVANEKYDAELRLISIAEGDANTRFGDAQRRLDAAWEAVREERRQAAELNRPRIEALWNERHSLRNQLTPMQLRRDAADNTLDDAKSRLESVARQEHRDPLRIEAAQGRLRACEADAQAIASEMKPLEDRIGEINVALESLGAELLANVAA
jgi:chromosome segregation ATPase